MAEDLEAGPLAALVGRARERAGLTAGRRAAVPDAARAVGLTPRELDVLARLAQGMTNRQIADDLFISVKTAGVHVTRILFKLGAHTRGQAVAIARRRDILPTV